METQEALNVLRQVGSAFVGNLQDHEKIQAALKVVEELVLERNAAKAKDKKKEGK